MKTLDQKYLSMCFYNTLLDVIWSVLWGCKISFKKSKICYGLYLSLNDEGFRLGCILKSCSKEAEMFWNLQAGFEGGFWGKLFRKIPAKPHVKNKLFQMAHARRAKFSSINTSNNEWFLFLFGVIPTYTKVEFGIVKLNQRGAWNALVFMLTLCTHSCLPGGNSSAAICRLIKAHWYSL